MKTNEQIYDEEIAPELMRLAKRCEELGFSFCANVEWEPGETGRTAVQMPDAGCKQLLVHWASKCNGNVDALIMAIDRHAREHGHSSSYLYQLGNKNVQYSGNEFAALTVVTHEWNKGD